MERISEKSSICAYFFSIILPRLRQFYLDHKKRGFSILTGALILSLTLSILFAFPLNWILWLRIGYGKCSTHFYCTNLSTRELKHLVINKVLNSTTFKLHQSVKMSNEAFDKFLLKLFEKTADKISYFNKYEIGKEICLLDKSEIDRIVKILIGDGFVANNEGTDSKIQITEKGKKRLENNQI
jgi:hypothetical protein